METLSEKEKYYRNLFLDLLLNLSNIFLEIRLENDSVFLKSYILRLVYIFIFTHTLLEKGRGRKTKQMKV